MSPAQQQRVDAIMRLCIAEMRTIPIVETGRHADWMANTLIHLAQGRNGIPGVGVDVAQPHFVSVLEPDFREPADVWISILAMLAEVSDLLRRLSSRRAS